MGAIARRDMLKGVVLGGLMLPQVSFGQEPPERTDLEGRPIQRIKDLSAMTELEKEHLITIEVPAEVKATEPFEVKIAMPNHPMERTHHVFWARTYLDNDGVSYMTFAPIWQRPETTLSYTFGPGSRLEVIAECNLHGLWGASVPLNMKQ
jgi:desulfoferrodoxin-like iron-binding protein